MQLSTKRIEIILAERGLTKAALAEMCGFHRQNLGVILKRGTCEPKTAGKIATGLQISVEDIIETEE